MLWKLLNCKITLISLSWCHMRRKVTEWLEKTFPDRKYMYYTTLEMWCYCKNMFTLSGLLTLGPISWFSWHLPSYGGLYWIRRSSVAVEPHRVVYPRGLCIGVCVVHAGLHRISSIRWNTWGTWTHKLLYSVYRGGLSAACSTSKARHEASLEQGTVHTHM